MQTGLGLRDDLLHAELPEETVAPLEEVPVAVTTVDDAPSDAPVEVPEIPVQAVANQLGDVAMDSVRLVELQVRLFEAELRQSSRQMVQPLLLLGVTGLIALASAVVVLLAAGTGLHEATGWSLALSQGVVAATGLVLAAAIGWSAWTALNTPRISFAKSKEELYRNVEFLTRIFKSR